MENLKKIIDLKFNASSIGIYFLADAVEIRKENHFIKMGEIYKTLEKKHNKKWKAVERNIRHCIKSSKNEYKDDKVNEVVNALAIRL
jgi:hypothetical protein